MQGAQNWWATGWQGVLVRAASRKGSMQMEQSMASPVSSQGPGVNRGGLIFWWRGSVAEQCLLWFFLPTASDREDDTSSGIGGGAD